MINQISLCQLSRRELDKHGSAAFLVAATGPAGADFATAVASLDPAAAGWVLLAFAVAVDVAAVGAETGGIP
jgi:hypothetical protein